jgi:hypothetical protein
LRTITSTGAPPVGRGRQREAEAQVDTALRVGEPTRLTHRGGGLRLVLTVDFAPVPASSGGAGGILNPAGGDVMGLENITPITVDQLLRALAALG